MPTQARTTCVMDCPDACALIVDLDGDKVTRLDGHTDHPTTDGFICSKVRNFTKRLYHPDRLLYPLARTGPKGSGSFARISWDEAIERISSRFRQIVDEHGGEAILPYYYGGSNGFLSQNFTDALFFARLGASRLDTTICAAPTGAAAQAVYGRMLGVAYEDFVHARFILIWGTNPKATSIHLIPFLKEAKRRGAFIAVVDPVNHFSNREIDLHLPIQPGTDLVLALGLVRYWQKRGQLDQAFIEAHTCNSEGLLEAAQPWTLERVAATCRLDAADIERLAETYATAEPALLRCGWGQERNFNGTHASAAILALPALIGKFGKRGGGYTMSNWRAFSLDSEALLELPSHTTRELNMTCLADLLAGACDPPIRALFVYNNNALATTPDQNGLIEQLSSEQLFTVVSEQVMTDTARYADIVLPATTFLEAHDIRKGYGAYMIGGTRQVVPPAGEARSNHETFSGLAKAMGFEDQAFGWSLEQAFDLAAAKVRAPEGKAVDLETLRAGGMQLAFPEGNPIQFETLWPLTPSGKADLCPAALGEQPYRFHLVGDPDYPLALISPASGKLVTSTFGEFNMNKLEASLHPDEASQRGIADGDRVRIFNGLGEVHCHAIITDKVRPGVLHLPKGAWRKSSLNGKTSTALIPAAVEPVAGGACFNDARVQIARLD